MNLTTGACTCNAGYTTLNDGTCKENCKSNATMDRTSGVCTCNAGYTKLNDGTCSPNCGENTVKDPITGACTCKNNYKFLADGRNCTLNCGQAMQLDPVTDTCVCVAGFTKLTNGQCSRNCGANAIFNTTNGSCTCPAGFTMQPDNRTCEDTMARYYPILSPQLATTNLMYSSFNITNTSGIGGQMAVRPYDSNLGFISVNANVTANVANPVQTYNKTIGFKCGMIPNQTNPTDSFYQINLNNGDVSVKISPTYDPALPASYGIYITLQVMGYRYGFVYATRKWLIDEYSLIEFKLSIGRLLSGANQFTMTINGINATGAIGVYTFSAENGCSANITVLNTSQGSIVVGGLPRVMATSNPAVLSEAVANSPSFFTCRPCNPDTTCRFGVCYPNYCVIGNDARPECGGKSNCPINSIVRVYGSNGTYIYECAPPHQCGEGTGRTCNVGAGESCTMMGDGIRKCTTLGGVVVDPTGSGVYPDIVGGVQVIPKNFNCGGSSTAAMFRHPLSVLEMAGYPPHVLTTR